MLFLVRRCCSLVVVCGVLVFGVVCCLLLLRVVSCCLLLFVVCCSLYVVCCWSLLCVVRDLTFICCLCYCRLQCLFVVPYVLLCVVVLLFVCVV